jgi:signal peptidase II
MPDDSETGAPREPSPHAEPSAAPIPHGSAAVAPSEPAERAEAARPESKAEVAHADAPGYRPSYAFLGGLSIFVLAADLLSKRWAVKALETDHGHVVKEVIKNRLQFVLARNPGGAWGMFHDQPEKVRKPFFVLVSLVAVFVIVGMYRKLDPKQRALRWGLPLVLGGALGNLVDRIAQGKVIDFIDYRADWVLALNKLFVKFKIAAVASDHWPTFNVADIAICVGVVLMAIDFLFPHKPAHRPIKRAGSTAPDAPAASTAAGASKAETTTTPKVEVDSA